MFDVTPEDITDGPLARTLVLLAAPLVAQNLAMVAQQVIDLFWVGRLGDAAVAGVGLVLPYIGLFMVPLVGCFTGVKILTSQRVGSEDWQFAKVIPIHGALLGVALSAVLVVFTFTFGGGLVGLLSPPAAVASLAVTYLTTYSIAFLPIAVGDTLESGFTAWGDSRAALYINLTAIVVNLVLDPFLILGLGPFPHLGVYGAALATVVGYSVGALFAVGLLYRGRNGFRVRAADLELRASLFTDIVDVGWPVGAQNTGRQLARLLMVAIVSLVSSTAGLAAYNIGAQIATIAFVPAQGVAGASTSVVGQNLGADQPDRANRATWIGVAIAVGGLSVLGVLQWLYPVPIALTFIPDAAGDTLALTVTYLQVLAYGYWALGAIYTLESGFNGASRTTVSMYSTLVQYWLVRLPVAAIGAFVLGYGVVAVFWGVTLSNVAAAVGLALYYRYKAGDGMLARAARAATAD